MSNYQKFTVNDLKYKKTSPIEMIVLFYGEHFGSKILESHAPISKAPDFGLMLMCIWRNLEAFHSEFRVVEPIHSLMFGLYTQISRAKSYHLLQWHWDCKCLCVVLGINSSNLSHNVWRQTQQHWQTVFKSLVGFSVTNK